MGIQLEIWLYKNSQNNLIYYCNFKSPKWAFEKLLVRKWSKNSLSGPIGRVLSLPCIIWLENSFTPKKHVFFYCVGGGVVWCGVVVVWAYLPFGTLDYARTIFFKFVGL